MSDTPRTDAASVSRAFIAREMDYYSHQFVLAGPMRDLERELAEAKAWKDAVLDEACIVFVGSDDPRDCIKQVIQANVTIALEPLVSAEAERLVESGRQEMKAENERLRADAADFHMKYRMKCDEETKAQAVESERLREALQSMVDVDDEQCRLDHNGYCQSHYLDHDMDGCRVAIARAALAKAKS